MDNHSINGELFKGFSKLSREERFARLQAMGALNDADLAYLQQGTGPDFELAENLIENVIGYFHLPLGVAANLRIDNKDYAVPMAVEETSIIAAVSKTAKWIREIGEITTEILGENIIGQIQIGDVENYDEFVATLTENKAFLIESANDDIAAGLVRRGGGVNDITFRRISREDGKTMAIVHVHVDPCDAMGANILNQICEYLKTPIQNLTGERVTMCILSNLNDEKITRAKVVLRNIDKDLGQRLEEASLFAELDPYRAATHNKGVLNGIDPILIATGNDWRAVEAGIHAYAARDGQYRSVTRWRMQGDDLVGIFEAPIIVGTVGGVTKVHPTAQMSLNMLGITEANELSRVVAAVGLVQNLGAITALATVGITQGHMKLHISNLTLSAGASEKERPLLTSRLEELLQIRQRITLTNAIEALHELRQEMTTA